MQLGYQLTNFEQSHGDKPIGETLGDLARLIEGVGYKRIAILDHHWQNGIFGDIGTPMFEAYSTLAFLAAHTSRVKLVTIVTNPLLRTPPMLARTVSTIDALSNGRAILGIGAGSHQAEVEAAGAIYPGAGERMARLKEVLEICRQVWSDDNGPFSGRYYQSASTMCSPQAVGRPRPEILVGGLGEQKLLRLVAQYADQYNFSNGRPPVDQALVEHKLSVLRKHCTEVGTDYDSIVKTGNVFMEIGEKGEEIPQIIADLETFARAGMTVVHGTLLVNGRGIPTDRVSEYIEMMGERVLPKADAL